MGLICVPPGGTIDPLQQSRKVGAYISLSDLIDIIKSPNAVTPNEDKFIEVVSEAIKMEFIACMRAFMEGRTIPIVRSLPAPEHISKND
jgi:hypothetical protein